MGFGSAVLTTSANMMCALADVCVDLGCLASFLELYHDGAALGYGRPLLLIYSNLKGSDVTTNLAETVSLRERKACDVD